MPLCERCALLTIDELVENDVLFQPDLGTLKSRGEWGCEFCALCWAALQTVNRPQLESLLRGESAWPSADTWTPTIWLRAGHFFCRGTAGTHIIVSCGKAHGAGGSTNGEPYLNPNLGVYSRLEVYEYTFPVLLPSSVRRWTNNTPRLPGCPTKYRLRGRRHTADQNAEMYIDLIQSWLRHCCTNHQQCQVGKNDVMPTRIIDVGDPANGEAIRLISTRGMHEPYIALSYCWGVIASDILTLNVETHESMKHAITESDLSKTHQEVLQLARKLGIRYVWIDALCIIQRDPDDWERESKTMADVYGNATLTVIAGRSADSRRGFITNNLASKACRPPPCILPIGTSKSSETLVVDLPRASDVGPVSKRGWCFQERLTSRRSVIFGDEQLIFECVKDFNLENGESKPNLFRPAFLRPFTQAEPPGDLEAMRDQVLKEWYQLLNKFTLCRLSDPHDIFAAIASLAQHASRALKSRYLAGLWECDIVRGLLWRPCYHFQRGPGGKIPTTRPKPTQLTKETETVVRAPSWSWAAVEGPVGQASFIPPRITRHKDPGYTQVRPKCVHPHERWTLDDRCGVGTLRMPSCELQIIGHIARAAVLQDPVSAYLESRPRWSKIGKWAALQHGVLLADGRDTKCNAVEDDGTWSQVVGMGFFDVFEESHGVGEVWCLLIVLEEGIMLKRNVDGTFSRIGWFLPEKDDWLRGQESMQVRLC